MAALGSCACGDKENVPPMPASRCPVAHGIAVVKNQRMKRPGGSGGGGKPRRRVPLRDITNLLYLAARAHAPPAGSTVAAARSREKPVVAAATLPVRRSLRKEFR